MKRLIALTMIVLLGALILSGCGAKTTPAATQAPAATVKSVVAAPTATQQAAQPTQAPAKAATQAPTTAPAATTTAAAEDTLSLDSRDTALDKLSSYRMRWQAQWKSTSVTETTTAGWDWTEEYVKDPAALHWVWKITSAGETAPTAMEAWQLGDTMYMIFDSTQGASSCVSISSEDKSSQLTKGLFSAGSLGRVSGARYVGAETVNGIKTKHYKYDEKSASLAGFGTVSGEIYVASDGGYVVKDVMQWKGGAGLFGFGGTGDGEGQWSWELSDANSAIKITPPEGCSGAAGGLPMLPDAKDKSSFGDMVTYTSATNMKDAVAFYKKEMVAAGWKAGEDALATDQVTMLAFSKEGQDAQVTITVDAGKTTVLINVTKQ